jgi:hypothetical protein
MLFKESIIAVSLQQTTDHKQLTAQKGKMFVVSCGLNVASEANRPLTTYN